MKSQSQEKSIQRSIRFAGTLPPPLQGEQERQVLRRPLAAAPQERLHSHVRQHAPQGPQDHRQAQHGLLRREYRPKKLGRKNPDCDGKVGHS